MLVSAMAGLLLGLSAGVAPGPLLVFVLSQTVRFGAREGVLAAASPLLSDPPIILVCYLVIDQLQSVESALGWISLAGAVYVFYLAAGTWRAASASLSPRASAPRSLWKGALTNLFNPHPYLFWVTVGMPLTVKFSGEGTERAVIFVGFFYVLLVGSKVALALLVGRWRGFLRSSGYRWGIRTLAALLVVMALILSREAWTFLTTSAGS